MGRLLSAFGAVLRMVFMAALVALFVVVGLTFLDRNADLAPKIRAAAATVVSPDVVEVVEARGSDVAAEVTDFLGTLIGQADMVLRGEPIGGTAAADGQMTEAQAESREVFEAINAYRLANGLEPLAWSDRLADFAQHRADDMLERNYFSHHDPDTGAMLLAELRTFVTVGENLYQITGAAVPLMRRISGQVVEGWRESTSHNELMLDRRMEQAGVALARSRTRIVVVLVASQ
jgi:uncharacterized protein YkwD